MSRSNPIPERPVKKYIEWSSNDKCFYYYDKEKESNVYLELPIYFLVLDQLSTVKGYAKQYNSGVTSNEVRNTKTGILHVKTFKGGFKKSGLWQDIKESLPDGSKYCKSVYALMITENGTEIVNFQFYGSAFSGTSEKEKNNRAGWINVNFNVLQSGVQCKEYEAGKNGNVEYNAPVFSKVNVKPEHEQLAQKADIKLQEYLKWYFANGGSDEEEKQEETKTDAEVVNEMYNQDAGSFESEQLQELPPDESNDLPWD